MANFTETDEFEPNIYKLATVDALAGGDAGKLNTATQQLANRTKNLDRRLKGLVFNVKDFGAVGDGTTDDTAAVQAALSAAQAAGGGTLLFPEGIFVANSLSVCTTSGVTAANTVGNVVISGTGWGSVLKQKAGAAADTRLLSVNASSGGSSSVTNNAANIRIENLQLLGTVDVDGFSEQTHLLNLNAVSNVVVDNVKFAGFRGDAIYLGSGNIAGIERHNQNVTVRSCLFDGVNNDNRNGITVIDVDGLLVENCHFYRCTKVGMPGPIDVEPNVGAGEEAWTVLRNLKFHGNSFDACGGDFGLVYSVTGAALTSPMRGLSFINNTFHATNSFAGAAMGVRTGETVSDALAAMAVEVRGNTVLVPAPCQPLLLTGVKGVVVRDNLFKDGSITALGNETIAALTLQDALVDGNTWQNASNATGILSIASVKRLTLSNNTFDKPKTAGVFGIQFYGAGVTTVSSYVSITGNKFVKGTAQTAKISLSGHTLMTASNRFLNNTEDAALTSSFTYANDDITLANLGAYDTTMLPDSFLVGETFSNVNGDTLLPSTFKQGVLRTIKASSNTAFRKFISQTYYAGGQEAGSIGEVWFRNGDGSSNVWSEWRMVLAPKVDTAAPVSGSWRVGDMVWNAAPTASGFVGWVCVVAGSPGTWKTFGPISA